MPASKISKGVNPISTALIMDEGIGHQSVVVLQNPIHNQWLAEHQLVAWQNTFSIHPADSCRFQGLIVTATV